MEEKQSSQIMGSIPQQPQVMSSTTAISSPDVSSSFINGMIHSRSIRKQRGIFTTSNTLARSGTQSWWGQNEHQSGLESGDHEHVPNYRGQFIQNRNRIAENEINHTAQLASMSSPPTDPLAIPTEDATEENNENSIESTSTSTAVQSPFVENAENLIGNYQVNPFDGSLVKIVHHNTVDGNVVKEDFDGVEKVDLKTKHENNGIECRDLSTDIDSDSLIQTDQNCRRKYRKRKFRDPNYNDEEYVHNNSNVKHAAGIPKPTGDKAEEVLKAAKSLFSKRTRTLYHWLYPSTSKLELKNIVVSAWDTLQESEKHFYISQVLGRFGFPASNLMVNPQIGGLQGMPTDHLRSAFAMGAPGFTTNGINGNPGSDVQDITTKRVVEELLANSAESDPEWNLRSNNGGNNIESFEETRRKRRKYVKSGRLSSPNESIEHNENSMGYPGVENEENNPLNLDDDFQNDPELSRELATFKTTVSVMDANNGESDELIQIVQI
ncbi:uncharacterized protein LOC123291991 [Chrysoperla carnea]|uniref:uncharacterized protein LOC123291991 n=1 Tax=Chrysoperla carnea TaxID=189513 RepID=UPI001D05FA1C|nr:uncharacterized protein LOC123291991 [Chrysoperla carnea]